MSIFQASALGRRRRAAVDKEQEQWLRAPTGNGVTLNASCRRFLSIAVDAALGYSAKACHWRNFKCASCL